MEIEETYQIKGGGMKDYLKGNLAYWQKGYEN